MPKQVTPIRSPSTLHSKLSPKKLPPQFARCVVDPRLYSRARGCAQHIQRNSSAHKHIVVAAGFGGIAAVGALFVGKQLIAGHGVAFYICQFAHALYKGCYGHFFSGSVGVESHTSALAPV